MASASEKNKQDFNNYDQSVKSISRYVQKKQLQKAKSLFVDFMTYMRKDRQCRLNYKIIDFGLLKQLDKAYTKIWTAGIQFASDFQEWSMISFLGWLHFKHARNDNYELSQSYFEQWHDLLVRHLKKYSQTPNYKFFYENVQDYFQFLVVNQGYRQGIHAVDEILNHSKVKNMEIHGYFLAIKGRLYKTKGNNIKALKYLLRAIDIQEQQLSITELEHYKCLEEVALIFTALKKYDYALKYHLKVYQKVNSEVAKIHSLYSLLDADKSEDRMKLSFENLLYISETLMYSYQDAFLANHYMNMARECIEDIKFHIPKITEDILEPKYKRLQMQCELMQRTPEPPQQVRQLHDTMEFAKIAPLTSNSTNQSISEWLEIFKGVIETIDKLNDARPDTIAELYIRAFEFGIFNLFVVLFKMYEDAISVASDIITKIPPYTVELLDLFSLKASAFCSGCYFQKSLKVIRKSKKTHQNFIVPINPEIEDKNETANNLIVARCYFGLKDYRNAIVMFEKVLEKMDELSDSELLGIYKSLAVCFMKCNKFDKALNWIQKGKNSPFQFNILRLICYNQLGKEGKHELSKERRLIADFLVHFKENALWKLCNSFEDLEEYFPLSFFNFRTSQPRLGTKVEAERAFNITKNSIYITNFLKRRTLAAKNNKC